MKKIIKTLMLSAAVWLFAAADSSAQIYVRAIPPHKIATVRPPRPHIEDIWLTDEWVPYKKTYRYFPGYWTVPPQHGLKWVPGKWDHDAKGYIWRKGRWTY